MFSTQSPYFIAEIGQAHDGSLGLLHSYIDAVAKTKANAVKFQMHIAEAESSEAEPFRTNFSYEDKSRFDYWKRMEFTEPQWIEIKQHTKNLGLDFIVSPFSVLAVNSLERIGVDAYKIGSGEISNLLMLHSVAKTGKPVILSSGMSDFAELDRAIAIFEGYSAELAVLQCTTAYPTSPEQYGFNVIDVLQKRYSLTTGFSDHSAKISTGVAAIALGAKILEFHVVYDREMFGPDAKSSLTIAEASELVSSGREVYRALEHPIDKNQIEAFHELKSMFGKSLAVNKNLPVGTTLTFSDLESKKPAGHGIAASNFETVIGRKLTKDLKKWDFLKSEDLE